MKSELRMLLDDIANTHDIENLEEILWSGLGAKLNRLRELAEDADEALQIHTSPATEPGYGLIPLSHGKPIITNAMKAKCIGEFTMRVTEVDEFLLPHLVERTVPWDVCKKIYKAMAVVAMEYKPAPVAQSEPGICDTSCTWLDHDPRCIAQKWREQNGYTGKGGVVVLVGSTVDGWADKLRNPENWMPGVIAVDELGNQWEARDGDVFNGAARWERVAQSEQSQEGEQ